MTLRVRVGQHQVGPRFAKHGVRPGAVNLRPFDRHAMATAVARDADAVTVDKMGERTGGRRSGGDVEGEIGLVGDADVIAGEEPEAGAQA